ncbi:MAG TPA: BON domain-containing protein [Acidimicrobiia bacterium]|nr:BON domain-containing protein [Acidimicrobiia bacterium]
MDDAPQYRVQQLQDALCSDERVAALDIHVRIVDVDVYLQGQVATEARRGCAEVIAAELLPDHRIHNDIRVLTVLDAADEEHLA